MVIPALAGKATQIARRWEPEGRTLRVSWNGHRHVRCEGGARERSWRDRRDGLVRACAVASRAAVVRAGSGRLGRCGDRCCRRSCDRASARNGAGSWHRTFRPDARRHACSAPTAVRCAPAILWNDGRSHAECAELERRCPSLHSIAGNLAMPGFTAPKLLWVARHEPEVFARVAKVLLPKAYVRYRLTGEMVEDMSDAAGTLWLDVGRRSLVRTGAASDGARSPPHAASGRRQRSAARFSRRNSRGAGAWQRMSWSPAARAIAPPARSVSAPLRLAMRSCRSERRACCSASPIGLRRRPPRPSTPSATRFPACGTRWA